MSYGLSTKAVGAPIGAGLRSRLAQPVKYIPLSHFFAQTGDEMEKYGIVGYADREEWGMLDPKEAKRGSKPVKAERETTKDPQKMKGVKKKGQKPPEDEKEPGDSRGGEEDSKAAEGEPDAKTDEKEAAADSEAEPETGPEDDSGGTADSGDEDADEKKPAKKRAKSGEEDDEEIDTEKNNPYLKHPFPPKEKSQEGASAPGNMLAEHGWELYAVESGGPLLPVKAGATRAFTGATGTGNIATAPVPIGAGDGRKFLDRSGKRKKKPRRLSGQLYLLIRP